MIESCEATQVVGAGTRQAVGIEVVGIEVRAREPHMLVSESVRGGRNRG